MIFFNQDYILVPFAIRLLCQQFPTVNLQEPRHYPIPRKPSWVAVCFLARRLCTFALQVHDGAYTVFMFFFTCVLYGDMIVIDSLSDFHINICRCNAM